MSGLLVLVAGLAIQEARSPVARALRALSPIVGLVEWRTGEGQLRASLIAAYHPLDRSLVLADISLNPDGDGPIELPRPVIKFTAYAQRRGESPPQAGEWKSRIDNWPRGLRFWSQAVPVVRRLGPTHGLPEWTAWYDGLLLAWEAYRLNASNIRLAAASAPALRPRLMGLLLAPPGPPADLSGLKVQVLNASGDAGIALQATKVLRWHRVDVIDFGNAPLHREQTRIVDRTGRPQDARQVARVLGCEHAELWTQLNPDALAPVAVELGRDFRRCRQLAASPASP